MLLQTKHRHVAQLIHKSKSFVYKLKSEQHLQFINTIRYINKQNTCSMNVVFEHNGRPSSFPNAVLSRYQEQSRLERQMSEFVNRAVSRKAQLSSSNRGTFRPLHLDLGLSCTRAQTSREAPDPLAKSPYRYER